MTLALNHLTEAILRLAGCPVGPEKALWSAQGIQRFLSRWPQVPSGSLRELQLLVGLLDPGARVSLGKTRQLPPYRVGVGGNQVVLAAAPCPLLGHVRIHWDRTELAEHGHLIPRAVNTLVNWWIPFGWQNVHLEMAWGRNGLAVAGNGFVPPWKKEPMPIVTQLMICYAEEFLRVRRRKAITPRTLISLTALQLVRKAAGEVVLADHSLERFLHNVKPLTINWQITDQQNGPDKVQATCLPLRDNVRVLKVLAPNLGTGVWRINGQLVLRSPVVRWPDLYSFQLPEPARLGEPVQLTWTFVPDHSQGFGEDQVAPGGDSKKESPQFYPNPILFESVDSTEDYTFQPSYQHGGASPGTYQSLIKGGDGITGHTHPLPLDHGVPEESDTELFARAGAKLLGKLKRRANVEQLVTWRFCRQVRKVTCRETTWFEREPPRLVQGVQVTVTAHPSTSCPNAGLREQIQRYLEARLGVGIEPRVQIEETDNE